MEIFDTRLQTEIQFFTSHINISACKTCDHNRKCLHLALPTITTGKDIVYKYSRRVDVRLNVHINIKALRYCTYMYSLMNI